MLLMLEVETCERHCNCRKAVIVSVLFPGQVHQCGSVSVSGSRVPGQAGRADGESLV